jgi:hypothetical protein
VSPNCRALSICKKFVVDFGKILAPQTTSMKKIWEAKEAVDAAASLKDGRSKTLLIAHCTLALSKGSDGNWETFGVIEGGKAKVK